MSHNENICPHCKNEMTLVFQNKRKKFQCDKCDADPLRSPTINGFLAAAALKSPGNSQSGN